jgi:replicative DNA helicase
MSAVIPDHITADRPGYQLRVPPHSVEAESSVLGALMLDNTAWDRCGDLLTEADFYRHEHREIFLAIGGLVNAGKTADMITVFERLQAAGKDDQVGGMPYLHSLAQYVPSASNLRRYAEIVRERALSRRLVAMGDEIATMGFRTHEPIAERIDRASAQLVSLVSTSSEAEWLDMDTTAVQMLDRLSAQAEGRKDDVLTTGLTELDEMLGGGLRAGQLIIIGARPSMGKSALAVTMGMHTAEQNVSTGMFSLEMPAEELAMRQASMLGMVHLEKLRRAERLNELEWPRVTAAVERMRHLPFYVSELGAPNINQIRLRARKLKRQHGLGVLIIDYLQLAVGTNPKENRNNQLGEVSRGLKALAKELRIPIIALAQLGRDIEKRTNPRPMMSDLKDCGDIEQDADVILFIDRPIMSNPSLGPNFEDYAEVIVGKQRNGPRGTVPLRYVGKNVQFLDWEGDKPSKPGRSSGGGL